MIISLKMHIVKFLYHISGPLGPLRLTASKCTICNISLTRFLWLCSVSGLLCEGGQGAIYIVSGTNVAPLGVGRNAYTDCNDYRS